MLKAKYSLWTAEEFQKMVHRGKLVMRILCTAHSPAFWNSSYGLKGTSRVWIQARYWMLSGEYIRGQPQIRNVGGKPIKN